MAAAEKREWYDALQQRLSPFALSSAQVNNPSHPDRTEDSVAAFSVANGEGFALVVADGMSSGGKNSKKAADLITEAMRKEFRYFTTIPYIYEVDAFLIRALYHAADRTYQHVIIPHYQSLLGKIGPELARYEANGIGATVCAAVRCLDEDDEPVVRIAARGDSSCYAFEPQLGTLELLFPTRETLASHAEGLTDWVARYHVGEMEVTGNGLFTYKPEGEKIIFTATDGWDIIPDDLQQNFVQRAYQQAYAQTGGLPSQIGGKFMDVFTRNLLKLSHAHIHRLRHIYQEESIGDDISIAAAYLPYETPLWDRPTQPHTVVPKRKGRFHL